MCLCIYTPEYSRYQVHHDAWFHLFFTPDLSTNNSLCVRCTGITMFTMFTWPSVLIFCSGQLNRDHCCPLATNRWTWSLDQLTACQDQVPSWSPETRRHGYYSIIMIMPVGLRPRATTTYISVHLQPNLHTVCSQCLDSGQLEVTIPWDTTQDRRKKKGRPAWDATAHKSR